MTNTYHIAFYRDRYDTAQPPVSPLNIAIISPGKKPDQVEYADGPPVAILDLDTDQLWFTYPNEILTASGAGGFDDPGRSFNGHPAPHPDPSLTTYRLVVYQDPRHYQKTQVALLAPGWRPEDARWFSGHQEMLQIVDLKVTELPVPDAYTNEALRSVSAFVAHDREMARLEAEARMTPEMIAAIEEYYAEEDRKIRKERLSRCSHLVQKLYGDTAADRAFEDIPDHLIMPPDDEG